MKDIKSMELSEYYDKIAELREKNKLTGYTLYENQIRNFFNHLPKNSLILDAGCAQGFEAELAEEYGHQVFGMDVSPVMIERFKLKTKNSNAVVGDMEFVPAKDNSFDGVVCSISILHCNKEKGIRVLNEFKRVLKSESELFIVISCSENAYEEFYTHMVAREINLDPIYFYHWNEDDFKNELNKLGFKITHWEKKINHPERPSLLICQAILT